MIFMNVLIPCDYCLFLFGLLLFLVFQNTIEGRLVYMPIVGRLDCGSTYVDHQGYWETAGYGFLSVYKSDWIRFGGKRNS